MINHEILMDLGCSSIRCIYPFIFLWILMPFPWPKSSPGPPGVGAPDDARPRSVAGTPPPGNFENKPITKGFMAQLIHSWSLLCIYLYINLVNSKEVATSGYHWTWFIWFLWILLRILVFPVDGANVACDISWKHELNGADSHKIWYI